MTRTNFDDLPFSAAVAVDVVIFTIEHNALKVLLVKRPNKPYQGIFALPGGFLQKHETTAAAAQRIMKDKAGIAEVFVEQLYSFDQAARDPRGQVVSVAHFALVPRNELELDPLKNPQAPQLFPIEALPSLAFDHRSIIEYASKRLRSKLEYTNVAYSLLPHNFTLSQLQSTYEAILGQPLDKRNFRKKFLSLGLIESANQKQVGARGRSAELYRFRSRQPIELQRWF